MDIILPSGYTLTADGRKYKILQLLGRGASSAAYLAECTNGTLTAKCILKEFLPLNVSVSRDNSGALCCTSDDYLCGKERFIKSGQRQNNIRRLSVMSNQTPPVSHIFEHNNTDYIDVSCFNGTTLDKLSGVTLPQYIAICRTLAKTVFYCHRAGYFCLDLKPENIFILQNTPDDTVTQLIEFIDFDSMHDGDENTAVSYTKAWAAPELLAAYPAQKISESADIYTIGEIVFYLLFGRHSEENEHRSFSKYPFDECKSEYRTLIARPDVQSLFSVLFRNTLRSSAANRIKSADLLADLLGQLQSELERKDYIIPTFPAVSPDFVGRDAEMKSITDMLKDNRVLFITGVGGIGKSTLVRNYIDRCKTEYDVLVYLEFEGSIQSTFSDDMQLKISTISRQDNESADTYFLRKLSYFKSICGEKRVLLAVDNFSGMVTKELSRIISCGYDTIIVTRSQPPKNSFPVLTVGAITDTNELYRLISLNLGRTITRDERQYFDEIIALVEGHTLVLELIARQIAAGRLNIRTALALIKDSSFARFSDQKVGNIKDGEEVYDTLSAIISALFDASGMSEQYKFALKILSLLDVRGLETDLIRELVELPDMDIIPQLFREGWIYADKKVRVHPIIAETVRNWQWSDNISDVSVMSIYQNIADIYTSMGNHQHIRSIMKDAKAYAKQHPRHIIKAMYFDLSATYYDTLPDGDYDTNCQRLTSALKKAVHNMELSKDKRREKYLAKYYLSLANTLMRNAPHRRSEIQKLIINANNHIKEKYCANRCYYCMVFAWYYTLIEPNEDKTKAFIAKGLRTAKAVFHNELQLIDIVYIPAANCLFYHNDFAAAAKYLDSALKLCGRYPDIIPFIDKRAELMRCLLDIYIEMQDKAKCREIICKIDEINEKYREQGIFREVSPEIRKLTD